MEHDTQLLSPQKLPRTFFEINYAYALVNFLGTLITIFALVFIGGQVGLPGMILIAVLVGIVQYRMTIVLHDCVHLSLFKGKRANTIAGVVAASMVFTTFKNFQTGHMAHHRHYRTNDDPSLEDYDIHPNSRRELIWFIVQPLFGMAVILKLRQFWQAQTGKAVPTANPVKTDGVTWQELVTFGALHLGLLAAAGFNPFYYLILVFIPAATIMLFLSRLRTFLEHGDVEHEDHPPQNCGRNTLSALLEQFILSPLNFNYHYWHHKYPALPSAQLPEFHNWYMNEQGEQPELTEVVAATYAETLYHFYSYTAEKEQQLKQESLSS